MEDTNKDDGYDWDQLITEHKQRLAAVAHDYLANPTTGQRFQLLQLQADLMMLIYEGMGFEYKKALELSRLR